MRLPRGQLFHARHTRSRARAEIVQRNGHSCGPAFAVAVRTLTSKFIGLDSPLFQLFEIGDHVCARLGIV